MQGQMFKDIKNNLTMKIDTLTSDQVLSELMDAYIYEGTEPFNMYNALKSIEENEDNLVSDMTNLIVAFTMRGTNFTKFEKRMPETGRVKFIALREKYNIVNQASQTAITPNRVLSAFPFIVAKVRFKLNLPIVGSNIINPTYASPSAASLILNDNDFKSWMAWFKSFLNVVIKNKDRQIKAVEIATIAYKNVNIFDKSYRKSAQAAVGGLMDNVSAQDLLNIFSKEEDKFDASADDDGQKSSSSADKQGRKSMFSQISSRIVGSKKANTDFDKKI